MEPKVRAGPALELRHLTKRFGATSAVEDVSLIVPAGRFVSLLGPSGSGKTTVLRCIGGFETPDAGSILIGGADVTAAPPHERRIGMVFQRYALFPHMTVAQNVAFPLRQRGMTPEERARRVDEMLDTVGLPGHGDRYPDALSGGQQQRVALARALIFEPEVLVLDEPLTALDKHLRERLQEELRRLQRRLGTTTLYVTHDQSEALALSDAVAVMNAGRIEQFGTPRELYEKPATAFVARFIGSSNLIDGKLVRPERMRLNAPAEGRGPHAQIAGRVLEVLFLGEMLEYRVQAAGQEIVVREPNRGDARTLSVGDAVTVSWALADAVPM